MASVSSSSSSTGCLKQVTSALPVTALSFLPSKHISESLLLAGEGSICKLYSPATGQLLHSRRIFSREAIRGISFLEGDDRESLTPTLRPVPSLGDGEFEEDEAEGGNRKLVFWGGKRIAVTTLQTLIADSQNSSAAASVEITDSTKVDWTQEQRLHEVHVKDWVHHASFAPQKGGCLVAVVTSYNQLHFYDPAVKKWVGEADMGEKCILYSATALYVPDDDNDAVAKSGSGRVIVAAGTVFGEIIIWSTPITIQLPLPATIMGPRSRANTSTIDGESWTEVSDPEEPEGWEELCNSTILGSEAVTPRQSISKSDHERGVEVHYRLKGHEGSIFGVNISPRYIINNGTGHEPVRQRYLVSCSDDRTVRVWNISRVDREEIEREEHEEREKRKLSAAWDEVKREEAEEFAGLKNTGFGHYDGRDNASSSEKKINKDCVAVGWGHQARVWNVQFLHKVVGEQTENVSIQIITTSEDLTSKVWSFVPRVLDTKARSTYAPKELNLLSSTLLHSGKNIFAMAIDEHLGLLATGGHDSRVAAISYASHPTADDVTGPVTRSEWILMKIANLDMDSIEDSMDGLQITPATASFLDIVSSQVPPKKNIDAFKNYAVVERDRFVVSTNNGWLALYTFPSSGNGFPGGRLSSALPGEWRTLGYWKNLAGISYIAAWEGSGLIAVQDKMGWVGIIDLNTGGAGIDDEPIKAEELGAPEGKGRWWRAAEPNAGPIFCGRCGDLYYLLTTSLVEPEVRLQLFPDPRVSAPSVRNTLSPPPRLKTVILCPPPGFQLVTSFHLDFPTGLLFLGSRSGYLSVFDIWTGTDADVMLNPLDSWRGFHDTDAVTAIIAYPTPIPLQRQTEQQEPQQPPYDESTRFPQKPSTYRGGQTRATRIITAGRNGVYTIIDVSLSPQNSRATKKLLHLKRLLNGGIIEGAYMRGKDLILYGFRGKMFYVWNETRGYEVLNEECGGAHRSWVFYQAGEVHEESGVGWFVWTQAGKLMTLRTSKPLRRVLQQGMHGREIKALAISPPVPGTKSSEITNGYNTRLIATGAEDTLIRLSMLRLYKSGVGKMQHGISSICVFKKHTTGIQHLAWSDCGGWLFSSGGVEEFYAWRVQRLDGRNVGVVCEAASPLQSIVPDLRIMGFDVTTVAVPWTEESQGKAFLISMVYSDSSIKVWLYDPFQKSFRLVISGRYGTCCLLHVHHFIHRRPLPATAVSSHSAVEGGSTTSSQHDSTFLLFIAGTDGFVTVYDITLQLQKAGISITPAGVRAPTASILEGATQGDQFQLLPPLIARPNLLDSAPLPTQLLQKPQQQGWDAQVHQSSVKSMVVMPLDPNASGMNSSGSRHEMGGTGTGALESGSRLSAIVVTGGDDTALAASVFTLERRRKEGDETEAGNQVVASWQTAVYNEAHASAITAVIPVRRGKMKWTGDVDEEPVKEVNVGIMSVGVDRVLLGWEISVLMGKERREVKVGLREARCIGKGYSPVADIAGAEVLGGGNGKVDEEGKDGVRIVVVGVGMDVWDVNFRI
ncbi:hypothetical protein BDZ91DRAFT_446723 [Kalaharituber pfeilii]|nr:hypothetical protein BDZ91DRAFT_446723 [Kalaharituber pfeilii]